MFSTISWSAYLEFIFFTLVPYYAVVIMMYWRKDFQFRFSQWQQGSGDNRSENNGDGHVKTKPGGDGQGKKDAPENKDVLFSSVHDLMDELKIVFRYAAEKKFKKEELLFALQRKLIQYEHLYNSSFQQAVDEHILQQAALQCEIVLDDLELKQIW